MGSGKKATDTESLVNQTFQRTDQADLDEFLKEGPQEVKAPDAATVEIISETPVTSKPDTQVPPPKRTRKKTATSEPAPEVLKEQVQVKKLKRETNEPVNFTVDKDLKKRISSFVDNPFSGCKDYTDFWTQGALMLLEAKEESAELLARDPKAVQELMRELRQQRK